MRFLSITLGTAIGLLAIGTASADEAFVPEKLTVEAKIKPGPNVFVVDQSWKGASRVNVLGANDFTIKGNLSVGLVGQLALSADHKTAYTVSAYAKRITYGPTEAALQEFDVDSLKVKREIVILPKMAQVAPSSSLLQLSADEHYALVQNATPATSVTVVDLQAGKLLAEIPTPGCWGIYPALEGSKFSTLCGDGTLASFSFTAEGQFSKPNKSAKIFDADSDPLFIHAQRAEKDLLFTSFNGNLYRIADKKDAPKLVDKFSYTQGIEGGWAPGGLEVMAYNPAHKVLFVAMHPDAAEGSHKDAAEEIWAIDLKKEKVLYRSVVEGSKSLAVTRGDKPVLYALNDEEGVLARYEIDPDAKFAAKLAGKAESMGSFATLVLVDD